MSILNFNEEQNELVNIAEFTDINKALNKLILLSKSGNILANELYEKINNTLENITNEISIKISSLNSLMVYKDLTEIFDSTLSLNSIKILPISIINESNSLMKKLEQLLYQIKVGNINNYTNVLNNDIYNYLKESHKNLYNITNELKNIINFMNSKKFKFSEIENYYLNYELTSYINLVEKIKKILDNYYTNENNLIISKVESALIEFDVNYNESIKKEKELINNLYKKLENKSLTIENMNKDDYNKINKNLINSINYISNILNITKNKIQNELDIKDSGFFISKFDIQENNKSFSEIIKKGNNLVKELKNKDYIDIKFNEIMNNFKNNYTNVLKYMNNKREEKFILEE